MNRFLGIFQNGMIVVYLAMAGVILFTPVFDLFLPTPGRKILVGSLLVVYSLFRLFRMYIQYKKSGGGPDAAKE